jgi:serine phosphatase RsbU (regulator of sigma subunit)
MCIRDSPERDEEGNVVSVLGIARDITMTVRSARLYESEHSIAETLQEALLAVPERIEGIEYGYIYHSATETAKVGGDFFDIFELENNRVGIVIGDVSGKGLEAASITSLARNTLRAYAYENESPAVVLMKTNNVIHKHIPASAFLTLFFGIIDVGSGSIIYCSAGHPSALLKRKTSGIKLLEVTGPILGAFSGVRYIDSADVFQEEDILLLYTDGITEARCNRGFYGEEHLASVLGRFESLSAKEMPHAIFNNVMECTSGKLNDDAILFSLAVVRRS